MTGPLVDELGEPYLPLKDGYTLTPIRLSDADQFVLIMNDANVRLNQDIKPITVLIGRTAALESIHRFMAHDGQGLEAWRAGTRCDAVPFRAIRSPDGLCIGQCRVNPPVVPKGSPKAALSEPFTHPHFGYMILTEHAGKGIVSSACQALVAYCKEWLEDDCVATGVNTNNLGSVKILGRLGFEPVPNSEPTVDGKKTPGSGYWAVLRLR